MYTWVRATDKRLRCTNYDELWVHSDEIFDMVNPVKPGCITLDDLIRCGVGGTVVAMLVDMQGFYDYDNREVLIFASK